MPAKPLSKEDKELLDEFYKLFDDSVRAVEPDRKQMRFERRFIYQRGAQWDDLAIRRRKDRPRPEINLLVKAIEVVIGEHKQSRVNSKVVATRGKSTEKIANMFEGLLRTVSVDPRTVSARDNAFNEAVSTGMGAYMCLTDDIDDLSFDVSPTIKPIRNAIDTVFWMVGGHDDNHRDSEGCFKVSEMPLSEFERKYPDKAERMCSKTLNGKFAYVGRNGPRAGWRTEEMCQIVEFWRKEPTKKKYGLFTNGAVYEINDEFQLISDELIEEGVALAVDANGRPRVKTVESFDVYYYKFDGCQFLEKKRPFPSKMIPIITMYGFQFWDEDGRHPYGLARHAIDAQRDFNYNTGAIQESTSLSVKDPLYATRKKIEGYEGDYAKLGAENPPVLYFNHDKEEPGPPTRNGPPAVQTALINQLGQAALNVKTTTGIHDQTLGISQSSQSGRAILAEQAQGASATFTIKDNFAKAVTYEADILIDMFPRIIDTERQERITNEDGSTELVDFVNDEYTDRTTGTQVLLRDVRQGKYDVQTTIGKSYATQRQENLEMLMTAAGQIPAVGQLASDLIVGEMDIAKAGEAENRIRKQMIDAGIVDPSEEDVERMVKAAQTRQQMQMLMQQNGLGPQRDPMQEAAEAMQVKNMENELMKDAAEIDKTRSDTVRNLSQALQDFKEMPITPEVQRAINSISIEIAETLEENDQQPDQAAIPIQ